MPADPIPTTTTEPLDLAVLRAAADGLTREPESLALPSGQARARVILNALPALLAAAEEAARLRESAARLAPYLAATLAMADPDGTRISDDIALVNDTYLRASDIKALLAALQEPSNG